MASLLERTEADLRRDLLIILKGSGITHDLLISLIREAVASRFRILKADLSSPSSPFIVIVRMFVEIDEQTGELGKRDFYYGPFANHQLAEDYESRFKDNELVMETDIVRLIQP